MREQAALQVIAEYNVAMRKRLEEFNELEKPIRSKFEKARKEIYDQYTADCKNIIAKKDSILAGLALEQSQND